MVFKADLPILAAADALAQRGTISEVLGILRCLSALDFGMLHLEMPNPQFPHLSRMLPRMAESKIQTDWTGSSGYDLFRQTKDFALRLQMHFQNICHRPLQHSLMLDYGCGWGRMARMMMYYTDPTNFFGVDPLPQSIEICREYGVLGNLSVSDYLPDELPIGPIKVDLAYAYSVFTHTSKRATTAALNVLRKHVRDDGLLVITVRPVEIWDLAAFGEAENGDRDALKSEFEREGFAFLPNLAFETDGDHTYGVATIAPHWIRENFTNWNVVGGDRGEDHLQYILLLKPC